MNKITQKILLFTSLALLAAGISIPVSAQTQQPARQQNRGKTITIRYIKYGTQRYMNLEDVAKYFSMDFKRLAKGVTLQNTAHKVDFSAGKRGGRIDKITVNWLHPIVHYKEQFYISELDFFKTLSPAVRKKLPRHKLRKIMIDPGHGGKDKGAPGVSLNEKYINLMIALRLQKQLKRYGFDVVLTRSNDKQVELKDRSKMCETEKPDLFISIHCNSTTSKSVRGIETWLLTPQGGLSTHDGKKQTDKEKGHANDLYNYRLAFEIQKAMMLYFPKTPDRGVKHSRFHVLRNATAPAILIEVGFISNLQEGTALSQQANQQKVVDAIIRGLTGYVNAIR